ncbi:reverse transcriptase domain, Reverse transcriptase zinc-binding domain protein [Artemisia annua]|uniref:Reverse transcriptase domain, Reverse transcriptase zinc-binding domain protein n=1 Tax=Artemisia annua TaxID=35608 RepID=A0A2U1NLF7_ARTAN|nr:reverse transcriptase domain, Reverse transcriptase zinc-binding domain protein [Artemisia annua]
MNLKNLLRILRCFHLASGLKVNLSKSAIYGVGVDRNEVDWMASTLKCTPGSLPFNYLGLPVGANMSIGCHWSPIIDKVQKRLSSWKARCLSIGGRLTLVKSVLVSSHEALMDHVMVAIPFPNGLGHSLLGSKSWQTVPWVALELVVSQQAILVSSKSGGGGFTPNRMHFGIKLYLLFMAHLVGLITAGNLSNVLVYGLTSLRLARRSTIVVFHSLALYKRKVVSGSSTSIWKDVWFGSQSLDRTFPRLFALALDKDCSRNAGPRNFDSVVMGLSLHDGVDGWTWSLDTSGSISVSILRSRIDSLELSQSDPATLWNVLIPKKVNIFFWRLTRNRLPTKKNMVDKGIDLHTVLCIFCDDHCESSNHIFVECKMVKPIWDSISRWCNVHVSLARSQDLLELSCSVGLASVFTKTFDAILRITSWVIWKHRNEKIFKNKDMSTNVVLVLYWA